MKKVLFFAISAIFTIAGYCNTVGEKIVSKVNNNDTNIKQQQQQLLILEQPSNTISMLADHYSHSSHSSHSSHYSHYSSR